MNFLMRIVALLLAAITPLLSFLTTDFTARFDSEITEAMESAGGFIKGVCHLEPDYEMIKQANIEWFRTDIPFPYNSDGSLSYEYIEFKENIKGYVDNGIKIFAVTPFPQDYIAYGLDPRQPESVQGIQDIAEFLVEDLKDYVGAFQIANEIGIDRFTLPLTMEEAAEFLGIQLEAMYPLKGDIIIGYNLCSSSIFDLPQMMKPYHQYCDYVGLDLYLGCFDSIFKTVDQFTAVLNLVRLITGKPIIMCEFGYIGYGEGKTQAEKDEILKQYGFDSEESAKADIETFINSLPAKLKAEINENYGDLSPEEKAEIVFSSEYTAHIYCELNSDYGLYSFEHTPQGQAEFFEELIPKLMKLDYVIGTFIYCWSDSERCYVCGQEQCPVETGWGLVDGNGNPKPAYYAVQKVYK